MTHSSVPARRKISPTKNPMRLSSATHPMSSAAITATAYSPAQIQATADALLRYPASRRDKFFSRRCSVRSCGSAGWMRSPRRISSQVTPYSSAMDESMEISGYEAPVSQLDTVLLETPSRSATSCWVRPFDRRRAERNSPIFGLISRLLLFRIFYHIRTRRTRIRGKNRVRQPWNRADFPGTAALSGPLRRARARFARSAEEKPAPRARLFAVPAGRAVSAWAQAPFSFTRRTWRAFSKGRRRCR